MMQNIAQHLHGRRNALRERGHAFLEQGRALPQRVRAMFRQDDAAPRSAREVEMARLNSALDMSRYPRMSGKHTAIIAASAIGLMGAALGSTGFVESRDHFQIAAQSVTQPVMPAAKAPADEQVIKPALEGISADKIPPADVPSAEIKPAKKQIVEPAVRFQLADTLRRSFDGVFQLSAAKAAMNSQRPAPGEY